MRKFAIPLAVVEMTPLAEEFCAQWAVARASRKPAPETHPFIRKIASDFFLNTYMALDRTLQKFRDRDQCPQPCDILRALLPEPATAGLIPRTPTSRRPHLADARANVRIRVSFPAFLSFQRKNVTPCLIRGRNPPEHRRMICSHH